MVFWAKEQHELTEACFGYWVENRLLREAVIAAQVRPRQAGGSEQGEREFRGKRESDPRKDTLNQQDFLTHWIRAGVEVREKQELYMTSRFIAYSTGKKKKRICPLWKWRRLQKNRYEGKGMEGAPGVHEAHWTPSWKCGGDSWIFIFEI